MYRDRDRAIKRSFFKLRIGIGISIPFFRFIAIGIAIPKFVDRLQACPGSSNGDAGTPIKSLSAPRRISSAVSNGDFQQTLHESSSSEEAGATEPKTNIKARLMNFEKKSVGRSPARSVPFTPTPKSNPARHSLFNSPVTPTPSASRVGAPRSAPTTPVDNGPSLDVNKILTRDSCELAIETMKASTEQLLLLQRHLAGGTGSSEGSESNLSDRERAELLQLLSSVSPTITHHR